MNIVYGIQSRPQRVVIYGQHGVGKTTLIAGLERPLLLDTEDGSGHLDCARVPVHGLDELRGVLRELLGQVRAGGCGFRTVALDTADRLWDFCAEGVLRELGKKSMEDLGYNKAYTLATERFKLVFAGFDMLCRAGLHVVIACHANVERMSPPDSTEYTAYSLKVAPPNKQAQAAATFLTEWADAVLFCRMVHLIDAKAHKGIIGGNGPQRVIETQPTAAWTAKVRCEMPAQVELDARALDPLFGCAGAAAGATAAQGAQGAQEEAQEGASEDGKGVEHA